MATKKHSQLLDYLTKQYKEFNQENSERLKALYSDFSKLSLLNKIGYDTNVSFWRKVILDVNLQGYLGSTEYATVIDKQDLAEKFQRPIIGRPLALECVLTCMEKQGELIPLGVFNTRYAPPPSWVNWAIDTVIKNTWYFRWRDSTYKDTRFVVLPTMKAVSKAIIEQHFSNLTAEPLLTLTQFKSLYQNILNDIQLTDEDIMLLLHYMHKEHGIGLLDNVKGYGTSYMVIKFPSREGEIANITHHDESIINIKTTCQALSIQVDELQQKSEELHKQSIEEKKLGHTSKALYCLRRKKNLQQILERRLKSVETMDNILLKIQTSKDDIQVIQAFNIGADALKDLLGSDGLTLESVDEVMEKIQNTLQDQKEIEDAMKLDISDNTDDDIIEQELNQLIENNSNNSPSPASIPLPPSPPQNVPVNSELSRLNQMFSSPKQKELA